LALFYYAKHYIIGVEVPVKQKFQLTLHQCCDVFPIFNPSKPSNWRQQRRNFSRPEANSQIL